MKAPASLLANLPRISSSSKWTWLAVVGLPAGGVWLLLPGEVIKLETQPGWARRLEATLLQWGGFAPLALGAGYVAQVFLPAAPGPFMALAAGYLFGPLPGALLTLLGVALGAGLGAWIMRSLARPLLAPYLPAQWWAQWERQAGASSALAWGMIFLVPLGDFLYLLSGLSRVSILRLTLAAVLGRAPVVIASAFVGHRANGVLRPDAALAALLGLLALALSLSPLASRLSRIAYGRLRGSRAVISNTPIGEKYTERILNSGVEASARAAMSG